MIKIHFIGGSDLIVEMSGSDTLAEVLRDPNGVLEVTHDGRRLLVPVRAVAAVAFMGG